jgi:spore germination cell wall hydrolase CwlJ-like protein
MYKKSIGSLSVMMLFILSFVLMSGLPLDEAVFMPVFRMRVDAGYLADGQSSVVGIARTAASGQRIVDYQTLEKLTEPVPKPLYQLNEKDYDVLLRIVEAEAGSEDEEGRLLVANVVLNRMNNPRFPDTVTDVVFQQSHGVTQFSPVATGSIWKVKASDQTIAAVERAIWGEDISKGALFFAARKYANSDSMRWFDESLAYLFKHGGHEFFK